MLTVLHIFTGTLALISGIIAYSASKGGPLHRKSGLVFVISMLVMAFTGAVLAAMNQEHLNTLAGSVTFYLVLTALLAVRRFKTLNMWPDYLAIVLGLSAGFIGIEIGLTGMASETGKIDGQPAQVALVFAFVALAACLLDIRFIVKKAKLGKGRLMRHVWRMGFAMFIATASLFLGQAQVFPEAFRQIQYLGAPVILVILLTLYWLVKLPIWGLKSKGPKNARNG